MSKRKKRTYRKDVTVGPNQRKTVRAHSKKGLDEKVEALKRQVAAGLIVGKVAAGKVANEWLEFHAIDRELEQSTILGYRNTIKAHITPLFGSYSIEQLTEQIIVSLIGHRQSSSPSTRRKILLVLRLTLTFAKRRGMIAHDPMEFMRLPGQKNVSDKAMTCMSLDQAKTFLRACEGVRFGRFFKILALTGMREGELLAARPQDFTKDYAAIWIRRTISDNLEGEAIEKDAPKTKSSRRRLPLPALAREAVLEEIQARLKEGRTHHNTLFSTSAGTPPQRQNHATAVQADAQEGGLAGRNDDPRPSSHVRDLRFERRDRGSPRVKDARTRLREDHFGSVLTRPARGNGRRRPGCRSDVR